MQVNNETKVVCFIGKKQSALGATMHNSAYEHLGLNFVYISFAVSNLKSAIGGLKAFNFRGASVSMPYKQEVIKYLDAVDPVAKRIGAVNTVSNDDGFLSGYNSDWIGAVEALKEVSELKGKTAVLVGAGGAGRAIAYGLRKNKATVILFNRTQEKAKKLAKEFGLTFGGGIEDIGTLRDYDILINATSVGFHPNANEPVLNQRAIKKGKVVMDIVSQPLETQFLRLAKKKDCTIVPGYRMLLHQALFQFELFTGRKAPFRVMEKALVSALSE